MSPKMMLSTRRANEDDYEAYTRLFPELGVEDPIPQREAWIQRVMPFIHVAELEGSVVGYSFSELLDDALYVYNLVTARESRRQGVGRALMARLAKEATAAGCSRWNLNVKTDNVAAIGLYEGLGFTRRYDVSVLRLTWEELGGVRGKNERVFEVVRPTPDETRAIEAAYGMPAGILERRAARGATLLWAREPRTTSTNDGLAAFAPTFPGVHPFRASGLDAAVALFEAMRRMRVPIDDPAKPWRATSVQIAVEDSVAITAALREAGAETVHEIFHFEGRV